MIDEKELNRMKYMTVYSKCLNEKKLVSKDFFQ